MKRRLIVNADDLGRSRGVNDGIFEAHRRGIVTSATLMVGQVAAKDAVARLDEVPELGVGLHLALSGGRPVSDPARLPTLVDPSGRLPRHRSKIGSPSARELELEITAQLERFLEWVGREPTHVDGHHHCHRVPEVLEALLSVLGRMGLKEDLPIRGVDDAVRSRLASAGARTTDFFDEEFYDEGVRLDALLELIDHLQPGTTELMCHPGYVDAELESSTYSLPREEEIRILTSPRVRDALGNASVELIHFGLLG